MDTYDVALGRFMWKDMYIVREYHRSLLVQINNLHKLSLMIGESTCPHFIFHFATNRFHSIQSHCSFQVWWRIVVSNEKQLYSFFVCIFICYIEIKITWYSSVWCKILFFVTTLVCAIVSMSTDAISLSGIMLRKKMFTIHKVGGKRSCFHFKFNKHKPVDGYGYKNFESCAK